MCPGPGRSPGKHSHVLGLDGVYDRAGHFTAIAAPSIQEMEKLCTAIAERVQRLLLRRAIDHDEPEERALALSLSRSAARLGTNRHAPEGTDLEHDHDASWKRKARVAGFDLEATTEVRPDDRERLEHLCCYLLRPPLAERRLRILPGATVALELKSPWRDGTTWLSMSAHTFLSGCARWCPGRAPAKSSTAACSPQTRLEERRWCPSPTTTLAPRTRPSAS